MKNFGDSDLGEGSPRDAFVSSEHASPDGSDATEFANPQGSSESPLIVAGDLLGDATVLAEPRGSAAPVAAGYQRGDSVGRYLILGVLGEGAMGAVYSAHDPELDRKLALKLLRPHGWVDEHAGKRLEREARTLAKLSHPNVVQVHDAGVHYRPTASGSASHSDPDVFVAMEYVEGVSLDVWQKQEPPPSWREVLRVYLDACRGLAAAHEAGVVHRDIKPSNIMIGRDGRVRVVDFGLAAARGGAPESGESGESSDFDRVSDVSDEELGQGIDDTVPAVTPGLLEPSDDTAPAVAPGWLEQYAAERLTHTGAVLGTPVYMAPEQHLGRSVGPAADQYSLCVGLYKALYGVLPFSLPTPKTGDKDSIVQVVSMRQILRAKVEGKLTVPSASAVPGWLASVLRRGLSPRPADRYGSMRELIAALEDDPDARRRAVRRRICMVAAVLAVLIAVPVALWVWQSDTQTYSDTQVSELLVDLLESVDPDSASGNEMSARRVLDQGAKRVDTEFADQPLIRARMMQTIGDLYSKLGFYDEAVAHIEQALEIRLEHYGERHLEVAATQHALGEALVRKLEFKRAEVVLLAALAVRRERHGEIHTEVADTQAVLAQVYSSLGSPAQAEPFAREALRLRRALYEGNHSKIAASLGIMGAIAMVNEDYDQAESYSRQAFEMYRQLRGNDSLDVAESAHMLARVLYQARKYDRAEPLYVEALGIFQRLIGEEYISNAHILSHLGELASQRGDYQLAREHYEGSLAIYRSKIGDQHPPVAYLLNALARIAQVHNDHARAIALIQESLAIYRGIYDSNNVFISSALFDLGYSLQVQGRYDEAKAAYQEARAWYRSVHGDAHRETVALSLDLAALLIEMGAVAEAKPLLADSRPRARAHDEEDAAWLRHHGDSVMGAYQGTAGDAAGAEDLLQRSYQALSDQLGHDRPRVRAALRRLIRFYRDRSAADKAAKYQALLSRPPGDPAARAE